MHHNYRQPCPRVPPELWDALYFLSITTLVTGLLLNNLLSWPFGAAALTAAISFRAFARAIGGVRDRTYRRFQIAFLGLLLAPLLIRGVPLRDLVFVTITISTDGLESIIANILKMSATGNLPLLLGLLSIIGLLTFRCIGLELGSVLLYWAIYCFLAPFFTLAIMLAQWSKGGLQQVVLAGGSVFSLFLVAECAYLILRSQMRK